MQDRNPAYKFVPSQSIILAIESAVAAARVVPGVREILKSVARPLVGMNFMGNTVFSELGIDLRDVCR